MPNDRRFPLRQTFGRGSVPLAYRVSFSFGSGGECSSDSADAYLPLTSLTAQAPRLSLASKISTEFVCGGWRRPAKV